MDDQNQSLAVGYSSALLRLDSNHITVPVNGFLMPLIALITLVNNALVLAILLRRQMRSPTNALLAALAVSDTLTSLCPLPFFVYFYAVGQRYLDWVPYSWCFAYFCLTDYLPTVFHTTSIWLTTSLAVQRYARVCCPVNSEVRRRLCSMRGSVYVIVGVFAAAVASQACRLGELSFSAVTVPSLVNSTRHDDDATAAVQVTACRYELTAFIARHESVYYNVYYWSRVILIHVVPCSALVVLNAILIRTMRAARHHRRHMSRPIILAPSTQRATVTETPSPVSKPEMQRLRSSSQRHHASQAGTGGDSSTRATTMLIVVVSAFLLVEVPLCVLLLLVIVENTFYVDLFGELTRYMAALFVNCFIAVTYPLNLFIYCTMSERFRHTLCALFSRPANSNHAPTLASPAGARRSVRTQL